MAVNPTGECAWAALREEVREPGMLSVVRNRRAVLVPRADGVTIEEPASMWPAMQCRLE